MGDENEGRKKVLRFDIEAGPPELHFYFAHSSGESILLTLRTRGICNEMIVYIDGIDVSEKDLEERNVWKIKGRFFGDGLKTWSNFVYDIDNPRKLESKYLLWGEFKATYDRQTRKGSLVTENFKVQHIPQYIPQ